MSSRISSPDGVFQFVAYLFKVDTMLSCFKVTALVPFLVLTCETVDHRSDFFLHPVHLGTAGPGTEEGVPPPQHSLSRKRKAACDQKIKH
jgi:hypothetical protein